MHFLSTISFQRMYTLFSFIVITNIFSVAMFVARDAPRTLRDSTALQNMISSDDIFNMYQHKNTIMALLTRQCDPLM